MRVILDTNILVSALITPDGVTQKLYRAWLTGRFQLLTCSEQLTEFRRVTRTHASACTLDLPRPGRC